MSTTTHNLDDRTRNYLHELSCSREDEVLAGLREETSSLPESAMQISVEQGRLMALLARSIGAKRALEVGVFTGYSSICVAQQLPPDGRLVACDVSEEWTSIARRFWEEAGVADRISLRIGPAGESLASMIDSGEAGSFDFAFIDADKEAYPGYYEQCLTLVRSGGLIAIDNIFMGGRAIDPGRPVAGQPDGEPPAPGPTAVHQLTRRIFEDDRVDPALVPISDGVLVVRKR